MPFSAKTQAALIIAVGLTLVTLPVLYGHAATADIIAKGQEIYEEYCAACHGYDGIRQVPDAPNFARCERLEKTDKVLLKTIWKGKGELMPSWAEELSADDMRCALAYIRTLAARFGGNRTKCLAAKTRNGKSLSDRADAIGPKTLMR